VGTLIRTLSVPMKEDEVLDVFVVRAWRRGQQNDGLEGN